MLLRYYGDGIEPPRASAKLPPFATTHPYHSDRIESQHGCFTYFPYYELDEKEEKLRRHVFDPRCMEAYTALRSCLFEIRMRHPERMAKDLMDSGVRWSHIFPDVESIGIDLEASGLP